MVVSEEQFDCEARASVAENLAEFGFSLTDAEPWILRFESPHVRLVVSLDRTDAFIRVCPLPVCPGGGCKDAELHTLMDVYAGVEYVAVEQRDGPDRIRKQIDWQLILLSQHCGALLRGDVSKWPLVETWASRQMAERTAALKRRPLSDMREAADTAYRQGQYAKAHLAYLEIVARGDALTPHENEKFRESQRRVAERMR